MKVYGNKPPDGQEINRSTQKVSQAQGQKKVTKSEKTKSIDRVEISEQGKKVAELMSAVDELPETRNEKVKAIKEAIRSGNYQVDSLKIAQKLLNEI